jgi:hypothetical protein
MQLLILDTSQIQAYIFGSNRLRENIGASYLVAQATGEWALNHMPAPHNVSSAQANQLDDDKWIERDGLKAEVIYVGGGNVVALFVDEAEATSFAQAYSRYLLKVAPGLQAVFWHEPFDWGSDRSLHQAVQEGFLHLAQKKQGRSYSTPLVGLGVTEMCRSTAFPAVDLSRKIKNDETSVYPISAETKAKLDAAYQQGRQPSPADDRLQRYLPVPAGYDYPRDFDDLGRSEAEQSYVAVVHADGDGMGKRFQRVGADAPSNRAYIQAIRAFSVAVDEAARSALRDTLQNLIDELQRHGGDKILHRSDFNDLLAEVVLQELRDARGVYYLPFRPLVFGGDDVTFVCDGRLGLSLALTYMHCFTARTARLPDEGDAATASAGVAIVKSHYPFARAYALAEELAKGAKKYRRLTGAEAAGLDWHFARSGLAGEIEVIRAREYVVSAGSLTLRPVIVGDNPIHPQRTWRVVENGVAVFQDVHTPEKRPSQANWSARRNKIKSLREALREGETAVAQFRAKFLENKPLPDIGQSTGMANWPDTGWQANSCGYFDAIEMVDWHIPLTAQGDEK